ncbi:hypothetical protein BOTBODRAFT_249268 [Botryobasidium botryosum FD-172 SS1]|uniref:Uncharacterized protein n=1 Tax=Botryobasidium botryosum (strain FD-172 SS1) TaxID=930990 RepID=A0A067MP18_BOTB1|nr:hypothetical protein BOTBODRAFT_249268 [Botryobasidium botryosum FD-172 SS1]
MYYGLFYPPRASVSLDALIETLTTQSLLPSAPLPNRCGGWKCRLPPHLYWKWHATKSRRINERQPAFLAVISLYATSSLPNSCVSTTLVSPTLSRSSFQDLPGTRYVIYIFCCQQLASFSSSSKRSKTQCEYVPCHCP